MLVCLIELLAAHSVTKMYAICQLPMYALCQHILLLLLLLNWVRATPDRPFMSYKSSSQTRLIGHTLLAASGRTVGWVIMWQSPCSHQYAAMPAMELTSLLVQLLLPLEAEQGAAPAAGAANCHYWC